MNKVDGFCDMFDTRGDYLGLDDVNAGLETFIYWQRAKVILTEAKELRHILKEEAFLCSCKCTTSFDICRMECGTFLLICLTINAGVVCC